MYCMLFLTKEANKGKSPEELFKEATKLNRAQDILKRMEGEKQ